MTLQERFDPATLIAAACEEAGSDDFADAGYQGWRLGLQHLTEGLINEARLSALGVEIACLDIMRALKNRLDVIAWRKENPEIASESITSPIFIVGQPRSGTTILYRLARPGSRPARTADMGGRRSPARSPSPRPTTTIHA